MIETSGFLLPLLSSVSSGKSPYRALIVGFEQDAIDEVRRLLGTLRVEVVAEEHVVLRAIHPGAYLGKGKLEEIRATCQSKELNLVVVDAELSPRQLQNIEAAIRSPADHPQDTPSIAVLDRAGVILEIFSRHARTRESKTQVELARLNYLLPRLAHYWTHFERQRGGIGNKGMGEKQIEVDRRLLRKRMQGLERDLVQIAAERSVRRSGRANVHKVALVGYTNAGKSTLLNALTQSRVLAEDKLFATLDASVRTLDPNSHPPVVAIDTVGFIQRIPPSLVASFRSTLEELDDADLLLHVVDASSPQAKEQVQTVEAFLKTLNLSEKPVMTVLNKMDRITQAEKNGVKVWAPRRPVWVSALEQPSVHALRDEVLGYFRASMDCIELVLPYTESKLEAQVRSVGYVESSKYLDKGVFLRVRLDHAWVMKLGLEPYTLSPRSPRS
jgi:GTP-binding protein HflX